MQPVQSGDTIPRYVPPYDSKEKHYFGFNYCGPGTNVWRRMKEGVKPMDELDAACYRHDLVTEARGPYTSKGDPRKLRTADEVLMKEAQRLSNPLLYHNPGAAASVALGMSFLLSTGARGRRVK